MAKTIITAALTGAVTPAGYNIPETPEQIAQTAYECWKLGAAVVHIHTRHEDGKKIMATNQMLVQRAVEAVKTFGNQPATPAEAREILGIPPLDMADVRAKLGL